MEFVPIIAPWKWSMLNLFNIYNLLKHFETLPWKRVPSPSSFPLLVCPFQHCIFQWLPWFFIFVSLHVIARKFWLGGQDSSWVMWRNNDVISIIQQRTVLANLLNQQILRWKPALQEIFPHKLLAACVVKNYPPIRECCVSAQTQLWTLSPRPYVHC